MDKLRLYLFVGYPGAGKTTIAELIAAETGAVHIWSDHERHDMFGRPTHSLAESKQLYDALNDRTAQLLSQGVSVIFDTNFNFRADREYLASIADKYSAETIIIWVATPKDISKARSTHDNHRKRNGYHEIMTDTTFEAMASKLQPPDKDEKIIKIDGTKLDISALKQQLW